MRWRNISSTGDYIEKIGAGAPVMAERRVLSNDERLGDALFTGLRLNDGSISKSCRRRYGVDVWERFGESADAVSRCGYPVETG